MKDIELGSVMTFKVISGEELIAKVTGVDEAVVILQEPLTIAPNHQGMGLIPSMFTAERQRPVKLNTSAVTMYGPTDENIKVKYIEATTGITTASKKIVLG